MHSLKIYSVKNGKPKYVDELWVFMENNKIFYEWKPSSENFADFYFEYTVHQQNPMKGEVSLEKLQEVIKEFDLELLEEKNLIQY